MHISIKRCNYISFLFTADRLSDGRERVNMQWGGDT